MNWTNTRVEAGNQLTLQSGGDTAMKGAALTAPKITANIGGNLNLESLQDSGQYASKQQSVGGSVTLGPAPGGSLNASKSSIASDFASVTEQSGIRAGDGGFNVNIAGDTTLAGGAITSTQKAIDDGNNRFATGGTLTTNDIDNRASYSAKSAGVNLGSSVSLDGKLAPSGSGAGFGKDSGAAGSTTKAGISGLAGNKDARTGDAQTGITPIFDADKVQKNINAQVAITQAFGRLAPKAVGDYAAAKASDLRKTGDKTEAQKWEEGGAYRVALHTALGGLAGGTGGALGASATAAVAPLLDDLQANVVQALQQAGANDSAAKLAGQLIAQGTAAGLGAAVGGTSGAAMAFNVDTNNRQLHESEKLRIKELAKGDKKLEERLTAAACAQIHCSAQYARGTPEHAYYTALEAQGSRDAASQGALAAAQAADPGGWLSKGFLDYSATDKAADQMTFAKNLIVKDLPKTDAWDTGTRLVGTSVVLIAPPLLSTLGVSAASAGTVATGLGAGGGLAGYYTTEAKPTTSGAVIATVIGGGQGFLSVATSGFGTFTQGALISGGGDGLTQFLTSAVEGKRIRDEFNFGEFVAATLIGGGVTKFTGPSVLNVGPTWGEQLGVQSATWPVTTGVTQIGKELGKPAKDQHPGAKP